MMRIVERGLIHEGIRGGDRAVAAFPSVTALPDGELLALYRVGRRKDADDCVAEIRRSLDSGRSWSEPEAPFSSTFAGVRGSLQVVYATALGDDRLLASALWVDREAHPGQPLFNEETEGCLPMRILVADSADRGRTWSAWREVAVTPDVGPPSLTNPVVRLGDGRLMVSIETNKSYFDRSKWFQRVVHCYSGDEGAMWTAPVTVCQDPTGAVFHWDQRVAVDARGVIAAFSWTYDKDANRYLPIRRHVSRDHGATWTTDTLGFSDQPSRPAVFPDGRAVLAWVDRYGSMSIRARMAAGLEGVFDESTEVVVHEAARPANATQDTGAMLVDMSRWSFGLPYAEALPDGSAMVVYYAGEPDRMDVRWARLC